MKPLVELISAWQNFTDKHPGAGVESFCHHYLSTTGKANHKSNDIGKDAVLSKLIGKTNSLLKIYLKLALRQVPGMELEWFYLLDTIISNGEIRKTDVTSFRLLLEPTTGIDILNRMIAAGVISERIDPTDKRARLVKATAKGMKKHNEVNALFRDVASHFFEPISAEHKAIITLALDKLTGDHDEAIRKNKTQALMDMEAVVKKAHR